MNKDRPRHQPRKPRVLHSPAPADPPPPPWLLSGAALARVAARP